MQDYVRVDLIFPRSGQVLPVYVPDAMTQMVADRNLQILFSMGRKDTTRIHVNTMHTLQ